MQPDSYAVSVMKDDTNVGLVMFHVKNHIVVCYFIENDGVMACQVTDQWKHCKGLEVPCTCINIVSITVSA